jgi:hypothetical protein
MSETLPSPAPTASKLAKHFFVYCGLKGQKFTLRMERHGEPAVFHSIVDAIACARRSSRLGDARLTVINAHGGVSMEWFI